MQLTINLQMNSQYEFRTVSFNVSEPFAYKKMHLKGLHSKLWVLNLESESQKCIVNQNKLQNQTK